jgi:hypothetical protein
MSWLLILILGTILVLAYAAWGYRNDSRRLVGAFQPLAEKYQGTVTGSRLLALPQLRFTLDGRPVLATAMASSGTIGKHRGSFTFVEVTLPANSGQEILIERSSPLERAARPLTAAVVPGGRWRSDDPAFNEAFAIKGGDASFLAHLLDGALRQKLMDARLAGLELRVQGPRISAHCDGIAETAAQIEELTALAGLLAQRCPMSAPNESSGRHEIGRKQ